MLGPAALTTALADLGADVIKVEPPGRRLRPGDDVADRRGRRRCCFLHVNRGKRSIVLNLQGPTRARRSSTTWCADADAVVEAMRPGALARMGLGYDDLKEINPAHRLRLDLGLRHDRPVQGHAEPRHRLRHLGRRRRARAATTTATASSPSTSSIGINAGPLYGALGRRRRHHPGARPPARARFIEIAQSDAAAAFDWYRIESLQGLRAARVRGHRQQVRRLRAPRRSATAGMREGVRYQIYETKDDGHVLFMASEQAFWKNFCEAVDRTDLFERWPGSKYADHARNNVELQDELRDDLPHEDGRRSGSRSATRSTRRSRRSTRPSNVGDDPQFQARMPLDPARAARRRPAAVARSRSSAASCRRSDEGARRSASTPTRSSARCSGYDDARIEELRAAGAIA